MLLKNNPIIYFCCAYIFTCMQNVYATCHFRAPRHSAGGNATTPLTISATLGSVCLGPDMKIYGNQLFTRRSIFSYEYGLNMCENDPINVPHLNIGQKITGQSWKETLYKLKFRENSYCQTLCTKTYSKQEVDWFRNAINFGYGQTLTLDDVPLMQCYEVAQSSDFCGTSILLGCYVSKTGQMKEYCPLKTATPLPDTYYIYNHLDIEIRYKKVVGTNVPDGAGRIVEVRVTPKSFKERNCMWSNDQMTIQHNTTNLTITYSYSVNFLEFSENDRINTLFQRSTTIHWFSIMNSLIGLIFMSGAIARLIQKLFCKDRCTAIGSCCKTRRTCCLKEVPKDENEFVGWKSIYGDVFRAPACAVLFCAVVGSGIQALCTTIVTLLCGSAGLFYPDKKDYIVMCIIYTWVAMAFIAGLGAGRLYKLFGGTNQMARLKVTLLTAIFCPGLLLGSYSMTVLIHHINHSTLAVDVYLMLTILGLWLGMSLPLTFVGVQVGNMFKTIKVPIKPSSVIRHIPKKTCLRRHIFSYILAGVLPMGCIMIELFFIEAAIWEHLNYNFYGYVLIVLSLYIVATVEATILCSYFHMRHEDHRWWWHSFGISTMGGVYSYIYCLYFYFNRLEISSAIEFFVYFCYTSITLLPLMWLSGFLGFIGTFLFVRKLYSTLDLEEM